MNRRRTARIALFTSLLVLALMPVSFVVWQSANITTDGQLIRASFGVVLILIAVGFLGALAVAILETMEDDELAERRKQDRGHTPLSAPTGAGMFEPDAPRERDRL